MTIGIFVCVAQNPVKVAKCLSPHSEFGMLHSSLHRGDQAMQNTMNKFIGLVGVFVVLLVSGCATRYGTSVRVADYPFLTNPQSQDEMKWRKHEGPDFDVFYGEIKSMKDAGVGFYQGGHPNERKNEQATPVKGRLGAFEVTWFQTVDPESGRIYRKAIFDYSTRITKLKKYEKEFRYIEKVDVWVYGMNEQQVEKLTAYLNGIKLFQEKPKDTIITN